MVLYSHHRQIPTNIFIFIFTENKQTPFEAQREEGEEGKRGGLGFQ